MVDFLQSIKSARVQRPGLVANAVSCCQSTLVLVLIYIYSVSLLCSSLKIIFSFSIIQAQFVFCHEVVADYIDSFETYANFKSIL